MLNATKTINRQSGVTSISVFHSHSSVHPPQEVCFLWRASAAFTVRSLKMPAPHEVIEVDSAALLHQRKMKYTSDHSFALLLRYNG